MTQQSGDTATPPNTDLRGDGMDADPPDYKALLEAEKGAHAATTKERDTARSNLGNAQRRADETVTLVEIRNEARTARLMAEAAAAGLDGDAVKEYVTAGESQAGIAASVDAIGKTIDGTIAGLGIELSDPRLNDPLALWANAKKDQNLGSLQIAMRVQGMIEDIAVLERRKQQDAAVTAAREEGVNEAKRQLEEGGGLDMGAGPGGTPAKTTRQPTTRAEAAKMNIDGSLSDAEYMKWLMP